MLVLRLEAYLYIQTPFKYGQFLLTLVSRQYFILIYTFNKNAFYLIA